MEFDDGVLSPDEEDAYRRWMQETESATWVEGDPLYSLQWAYFVSSSNGRGRRRKPVDVLLVTIDGQTYLVRETPHGSGVLDRIVEELVAHLVPPHLTPWEYFRGHGLSIARRYRSKNGQ